LVADLNQMYRKEPALHELDFDPAGFEWIEADDAERGVVVFLRRAENGRPLLCLFNFTPVVQHDYRVGVPIAGSWREVVNTDAQDYCGSGQGNCGEVEAHPTHSHGRLFSLNLTVPPLGAIFLSPLDGEANTS
jgi:1,4-alpha-glucan branching enzyme